MVDYKYYMPVGLVLALKFQSGVDINTILNGSEGNLNETLIRRSSKILQDFATENLWPSSVEKCKCVNFSLTVHKMPALH